MSEEWDGPLPLYRRYPGLTELDYQSIKDPKIGIVFYQIIAQLPEELKAKLMKKETKTIFCSNIRYAYDKTQNWSKGFILENLQEIRTIAGFNDEECKLFIQAIEQVCEIQLLEREPNAGSLNILSSVANGLKKIFG